MANLSTKLLNYTSRRIIILQTKMANTSEYQLRLVYQILIEELVELREMLSDD